MRVLTYHLDSIPNHGRITSFDSKQGTMVYEPTSNTYFGMDDFKFHVTDTLNQVSNGATARIAILPNHLSGVLIGPEGGTITVNGTTLTIPPGALNDYKRFDITRFGVIFSTTINDVPSSQQANDVSPSGTNFNNPSTYQTNYDPSQLPTPSSPYYCTGDASNKVGNNYNPYDDSQCLGNHLSIANLDLQTGQWQAYPTSPTDDGTNRIQTQISHLSIYGIVLAPVSSQSDCNYQSGSSD